MKISWLAVQDPNRVVSRMCTWSGESETVVVTGVPIEVWKNAPLSFEYEGAEVHAVPHGMKALELAEKIGGVAVTRFKP